MQKAHLSCYIYEELKMRAVVIASLCFLSGIAQAMELPKPMEVFKQEIIHLDLPFPYEWSCEAFLRSPYSLRHYDGRVEWGAEKYKKEIFCALIHSRLSNKQSLDIPVCFWHKRGGYITKIETPLIEVADDRFISITQLLLAKGAEPNVCFQKRTALEKAVSDGQIKTVQALLAAGAQVKDKQLLHACSPHNNAILKLLLSHGASANERDQKGRTPLMICDTANIQASDIAALVNRMRLLFSYGAKANARDNKGRTVLHFLLKGAGNNIRPLLVILKHQGLWTLTRDYEGQAAMWRLSDGRFGFEGMQLVKEVFYDERERLYNLLARSKSSPFKGLPADAVRIIVGFVFG